MAEAKASLLSGERRPFHSNDVFRSRHVANVLLSEDGSLFYELIETVGSAASSTERKRTTIWRSSINGGDASEITSWAYNATAPTLSADGESLYFMAAIEAGVPPQVYCFATRFGTLAAVTASPTGIAVYSVSPDDKQLVFVASELDALQETASNHVRITTLVYRFDAIPGYLQHYRQKLYVLSLTDKEVPRALFDIDGICSAIQWSPCGTRFAYQVNFEAHRQHWFFFGNLFVGDTEGNKRCLLDAKGITLFNWNADGERIFLIGQADGDVTTQNQLSVVEVASGAIRSVTQSLDICVVPTFQINSPAMMTFGRILEINGRNRLIVSVGFGGEGRICSLSLDEDPSLEPIVVGSFIARPYALAASKLVYLKQDIFHPSEIWIRDLATGEDRQITDHNSEWQREIAWSHLERITARSDGGEIEGWVLTPSTGSAPHPAILLARGGPHGTFGYGYSEELHELASAGYAVIFPNPRGSATYGEAFVKASIGCWGDPELDDLNAIVDKLVDGGTVDPDRLGITGFSGGGYLTAWVVTHSDRFKAAIPESGIYNLFDMFGSSDVGLALMPVHLGGAPQDFPMRYWDRSPVAHARNCKTPTLIIHGDADVRCRIDQAEQFFTALKIAGCDAELLCLRGCNHVDHYGEVPALRRIRMNAIKSWFSRYLLPNATSSET